MSTLRLRRASMVVALGVATCMASSAQAGGRGGAVVVASGGAVAVAGGGAVVTTGGGAVFGRPIVGVFPTAPAAIAPSFRNSNFVRSFYFGPRPVIAGVVPAYVGPPAYYDPAYGVAPQAAYAPPAQAAAPPSPPPPPQPQVVEYADGRYELRGDGVNVPYRWVWVPNPPPASPSAATKRGPDTRLYAYTDEQGVVVVTDRLDRVPERYREQAKRNASS